ncbi:MAG: hypothetical protein M1493_05830 [Firmicutes bacterium]|nr:hypothetical protein [Bacillota bacterium]
MNVFTRRLAAVGVISLISVTGTNWGFTAVVQAAGVPGPIYKLASKPAVYVERHGTLHQIPSVAIFYDLGYQWSQLHVVQQLPDAIGSPVELLKLPTKPAIYLYQQGTLHWIPSARVFNALGYHWDNVYNVAKLPAVIGRPVSEPAALPQEAFLMSGFPYVPVSGTKTFVVDAFTNTAQFDSTYGGTSRVTITQNPGHLSVYNGATWVDSGSVPVYFHHGQGTIQVKGGSSAWGEITLQPASQSSSAGGANQQIETVPNTTSQVGWRVFTPKLQAVAGNSPAYAAQGSQPFLVEPVNSNGQIVPGVMRDGVSVVPTPRIAGCPQDITGCQPQGLYVGSHGTSFSYSTYPAFPPDAPFVFAISPLPPQGARVSAVSASANNTSLPILSTNGTEEVTGIQPNTHYTIQLQLLGGGSNDPITDLPLLTHYVSGLNNSSFAESGKIIHYGIPRSIPAQLGTEIQGQNHITVSYTSGSPNYDSQDILQLYRYNPDPLLTFPGPPSFSNLDLVTNGY